MEINVLHRTYANAYTGPIVFSHYKSTLYF